MTKVLLVEDEAAIRELYADMLTEAGYEVMEAEDGLEAWQKIIEKGWDVLLLDIMLPKLDGIEILKKMQADESLRYKVVIMLSNLEDPTVQKTCKDLGAQDFLVKSSIVPQDVVNTVNKYFSLNND